MSMSSRKSVFDLCRLFGKFVNRTVSLGEHFLHNFFFRNFKNCADDSNYNNASMTIGQKFFRVSTFRLESCGFLIKI